MLGAPDGGFARGGFWPFGGCAWDLPLVAAAGPLLAGAGGAFLPPRPLGSSAAPPRRSGGGGGSLGMTHRSGLSRGSRATRHRGCALAQPRRRLRLRRVARVAPPGAGARRCLSALARIVRRAKRQRRPRLGPPLTARSGLTPPTRPGAAPSGGRPSGARGPPTRSSPRRSAPRRSRSGLAAGPHRATKGLCRGRSRPPWATARRTARASTESRPTSA